MRVAVTINDRDSACRDLKPHCAQLENASRCPINPFLAQIFGRVWAKFQHRQNARALCLGGCDFAHNITPQITQSPISAPVAICRRSRPQRRLNALRAVASLRFGSVRLIIGRSVFVNANCPPASGLFAFWLMTGHPPSGGSRCHAAKPIGG